MSNGGTDGYPCSACGAEVPAGRTVCPACSTWQRTAAPASATSTASGPAAPARAPAPTPTSTPFAAAPSAPPPRRARSRRSVAPLVVVIVLLVAAVAGGWYLTTRGGNGTSDTAAGSSKTPDPPATDLDRSDLGIDGSGPASTAPGTPSSTAPSGTLPWTPVSDPATGIRWSMPGSSPTSMADMPGLAIGGPTGGSTSWLSDLPDMAVDVTVWNRSNRATQADIDEVLTFDHDLHKRINQPYGRPLTLAGQPATAVLSKPEPDNTYVAMAVVDGALVRVQVSANGKPVDPKVFEKVVASFAQG